MQAYSRSQGKIIEVPDTQAGGSTTGGATTAQKFQQAAMADLLTTGGKNLSTLNTLSGFFPGAKPEEDKNKKESKPIVGGLVQTLQNLKSDAERINLMTPVSDILRGNFVDTQLKQFDQRKKLASQALAKMVEKGRLSDADRRFYLNEITNITPFGPTESKNQMIDRLTGDIARLSGFSPEEFGVKTEQNIEPKKNPLEELLSSKTLPVAGGFLGGLTGAIAGPIGGIGGAAAGYAGGDVVRKELAKLLNVRGAEPTNQLASVAETGMGAAGAAATEAVGLGAGKVLGYGAGKLGQLFKPQITEKMLEEAARATTPTIEKTALNEGLDLIKKGQTIRNEAIKKAAESNEKIGGKGIFNAVKKWAIRAKRANPTQTAQIDNFVAGASKKFNGKQITINTAKELWDDAHGGFTAAERLNDTVAGGYHRAIRDTVRDLADKVAPGFENGTKMMRQGYVKEKLLKSIRTGLERKEIREGLQPQMTEGQKLLQSVLESQKRQQIVEATKSPAEKMITGTLPKVAAGAGGLLVLQRLLRGNQNYQ